MTSRRAFLCAAAATTVAPACSENTPVSPYDLSAPKFGKNDAVWDAPEWLERSREYTASLRRAARERRLAPEPYLAPLAFLVGDLCRAEKTSVLDIGGGVGPCVDVALMNAEANYTVVDSAANCRIGKELFPEPNVRFLTDIPEESFDIVLLSSVLQYIEDWRSALEVVLARRPRYVYLSRIPMTAGPQVAVRQAILGAGRAWHWLFREPDIRRALPGYQLVHDAFIRDITAEVAAAGVQARAEMRVMVFAA